MDDTPKAPAGRGPLGGHTRSPIIDCDTMGRHLSEANGPACGVEFEASARAMLISVRSKMDDYAEEIFDLWFLGDSGGEVTFDNPKWAKYMREEERLEEQIQEHLADYGEAIRDEVDANPIPYQKSFKLRFHAEVGSESGGYFKGYNVLHGSNKDAGDFE